MKQLKFLAPLVALAFVALLIACKPAGLGGAWVSNTDCKACHSGETSSPYGLMVLADQAAYAQTGHLNGPRVLTTLPAATTGEHFEFDGSDAMYANGISSGTACSKCHTDQGFVSYLTSGSAGNQVPASPPGCFTCHKPHETGDFSLRTKGSVTLVDGSSFNAGAGNLCANCHQSLTGAASWLTGYATTAQSPVVPVKKWASYNGPHHGPQSDFLMGKNAAPARVGYTPLTYPVSAHIAAPGAPVDSCVSCHTYDPASGNFSGSLQLGGHGFYLTGDVHGAQKDVILLCASCHTSISTAPGTTDTTFEKNKHAAANWSGYGGALEPLTQIKVMRDSLVVYFATPAKFPAGTPTPIVTPTGGAFVYAVASPSTIELNRDFIVNTNGSLQLNQQQSEAWWNLQMFLGDKSDGIHNPTYAARLLWDAITNLNAAPSSAGITIGVQP